MGTRTYDWRIDGNFWIRVICTQCQEVFDAHAMSNTDPLGLCPACRQVHEWEKEEKQNG